MIIRKATIVDTEFIATMIMMALHMDMDENRMLWQHMQKTVAMDDTLYSWRKSLIAEVDGKAVGLCLAYDACDYHDVKERTFGMFPDISDDIKNQPDEAGTGEYYIDSLAVLPEYRGRGIASQLIAEAKKEAQQLALTPSLLVDPVNENAKALYSKMGFHYHSEQFAFGIVYEKWYC